MSASEAAPPNAEGQGAGTAREFAAFCERERQRYHNAEKDFDPTLFDEAVAYVLHKLTTRSQELGA